MVDHDNFKLFNKFSLSLRAAIIIVTGGKKLLLEVLGFLRIDPWIKIVNINWISAIEHKVINVIQVRIPNNSGEKCMHRKLWTKMGCFNKYKYLCGDFFSTNLCTSI
jgi:hypothetical protein